MKTIAQELIQTTDAAAAKLRAVSPGDAALRRGPGRWSKKEIIGHLIDSAANNHQRFVRAQHTANFAFPNYEQEHWVMNQDYETAEWPQLVEFWLSYNHHLAHVITRIPKEKLALYCTIGDDEPVTLGFLVEDYLRHLQHHLAQAGV